MKRVLLPILLFCFVSLHAQTGPGGVGTATGSSALKAWYRVDNGVATTGSLIDSWTNSAGITALSVAETGTTRPTLVANAVNGFSEASFNGTNRLVTATGAMTTSNFVTNAATTFIVTRADNTTQTSSVYMTDPLAGDRFSSHIPWAGTVYSDLGVCCGSRLLFGGLTGLTSYSVWSFDAENAGKNMYRNGTLLFGIGLSTVAYAGHATQRFNIGGISSGGDGFEGDVTELIIYNSVLNESERKIVQNYLAAKYGLPLAADDLYTMDNPANGNYDYDVAGIGKSDVLNAAHTDSRGTGLVRMSGATSLNNGDFFFWGHDNGSLQPQNTDVPAGVAGRYPRVWRGQETGAVGNMDVDFDLTGLGSVVANQLRLLIDTDGDATFADETPINGATAQGANVYRFANVTGLTAGANATRRFTLASTNLSQTPLPITLISFEATVTEDKDVKLLWTTAHESNNAFFTLERSTTGTSWEEIKTVPGSGNSVEAKHYSSVDEDPFWGMSYYRLKQTDFDGTSTYSDVRAVTVIKSFKDIEVYPVPATHNIFVDFPPAEHIVIKISDQLGREQQVFPENESRGVSFNVSALTPGVYFLHISNGKDSAYRKILVE